MASIVECLNLINYIDISNNNLIINNINLNENSNINFGLYTTTSTKKYLLKNIPKNYPIGFYSHTQNISDISHLIQYTVSYTKPIIIYVSNGNDLSYSNGDYYRFYDESFNLINIYENTIDNVLTTSAENFYFMRNMQYKFIATYDFSLSHPFSIKGYNITNDLSINNIDDSFNFIIPSNTNNLNNKIYYTNLNNLSISGELNILTDNSNISYYYNNIVIDVSSSYENLYFNDTISIKTLPIYNKPLIQHTEKFIFSDSCSYIIAELSEYVTLLAANDTECLNIVSKATLDISNGKYFYELNTNNHGLNSSYIKRSFLDYGVYDGSYVIFNINPLYPITIINNDVSLNIYIDETYFRTKIINKNDIRIRNLSAPYNTYNYYYDSIRIIVNNFNNLLTNNDIEIRLFDLNTLSNYELNNKFIYTSFCIDSDNVNNIISSDISFLLYNQVGVLFNQNKYNQTQNIYQLNLNENYVEPIPSYYVTDRYNYDISNLVTSNAPTNINLINFDISNLLITYNVIDYENNSKHVNRLVNIYNGPFIEIKNINNIFNNNNQYTNLINIPINSFNNSYNFFDNIDVYIYDNNKNKILLPFEIILTGYYYLNNSTFFDKNIQYILLNTNNSNILKYNNQNSNQLPLQFTNNNVKYNYYLSSNFNFNYRTSFDYSIDETGINITNINNIQISNPSSLILDQFNILQVNDRINESYNQYLAFRSSYEDVKTLTLDADTNRLIITKVDNNTSLIELSQIYFQFVLKTSVNITNNDFIIDFIDLNNSNNNLTITGTFNNVNFFDKTLHIDPSFVGKYFLNIIPKGLSNEDIFINDISNIINIDQLNIDYKRTITINIFDNTEPSLNFVNNNIISNEYEYIYSRYQIFNIIDNINYYKKYDTNQFDTIIPLIEYDDNNIYNGDLSYNIIYKDNNLLIDGSDISVINNQIDTSAIIQYIAYDICGNLSNSIYLTLNLLDVPYIELSGNSYVIISFEDNYYDHGINLQKNNSLFFAPTQFFNDSSNGLFSLIDPFTPSPKDYYDISWSTNINTNIIGEYYFLYNVTKKYYNGFTYVTAPYFSSIKRTIIITDTISPWFYFPKLNNIPKGYIDASNGYINDPDYFNIINNPNSLIINSIDNTFNIDFSLTIFSHFDDLSHIVNYFDICDNYTIINKTSNVEILLSVSGIIIPFTQDNLHSIKYIDDNSHINIVTIGENSYSPLIFNYIVNDEFDNSFNILRKVDIIDIIPPTIEFSFNSINNSINYVIFNDNNYIDFSYQAFDYDINNQLFINEINSILFNFEITDNYDICNNSYIITITDGIITQNNIKNVYDISTIDIFPLFSELNKNITVTYDFSDNQYNYSSIIRNISIINTINPNISFTNNQPINISFGDINYNLNNHFNLSHSRILSTNLDLSYILPDIYTTFSGENLYDPSALIYPFLNNNSYIIYDISFYSILYQNNITLSSEIINKNVKIINQGPIFNNISYIITSEAGIYISDASLIFDIEPISEYDKFYYYNFLPEISYNFTIFDISFDSFFDQNNPEVGNYYIYYKAIDKNNQTTTINRLIQILDNIPPNIIFDNAHIIIEQFQQLIMPNAYITDIGSGINTLNIDLSNNYNTIINNKYYINNINLNNYNFSLNVPVLSTNDTSSSLITYTLTYKVNDYFDNSINKGIFIIINPVISYIIYPYIGISNNYIQLNENFNLNFNNLLIDNSSILFDSNSIIYDNDNKLITYEATNSNLFNYINFDMSAIYNNIPIDNTYNTIIYSIIPNIIGTYDIFFQSYNPNNFDNKTEIINFKITDTTPPKLQFIKNIFFDDINNIKLPLISIPTLETLKTNINYLYNPFYKDIIIFTRDIYNSIIYSIPGIQINDIVNGYTITLSNETLPIDKQNIFTLDISYNIYSTNTFVDNSFMLLNENIYIQNYRVYDDIGNFIDLSRNIFIERFEPFIILNYPKNANNQVFNKTYHIINNIYKDLLGNAYDYYIGSINDNPLIIKKNIIESQLGIQNVRLELEYDILGVNTSIEREVHVVEITCLKNISIFDDIFTNNINNKIGIFDGSYILNIDNSNNPIRIFGYDYDNNFYLDISNLINVSSNDQIIFNNNIYYWGKVLINVYDDFNRANIEYLDISSDISFIIQDAILYTNECNNILLNNLYDNLEFNNIYYVDVSGFNINNQRQFYTLYDTSSGITYTQPALHLPIGKYRFIQSGYRNFYNRLKFSTTNDGIHNSGIEYTKDVYIIGIPGTLNSYTDLVITATSSMPLYYYSDNFPNMGNIIETKNNIIINNGDFYIVDNVLSIENKNILPNLYGFDVLINKIFVSHKFDLSSNINNIYKTNQHFVCITHQNINHNIGVDKSKHKIIFKKYQYTDNFDPVTILNLSNPVPQYIPGSTTDLSNNLKHDVSDCYLFDISVNNNISNVFHYDYIIDTSYNIITNFSNNIFNNEYVIGLGTGINNIIFSNDYGLTWSKYNIFSNKAISADYNNYRWIVVGQGINTIAYSDNGNDWYYIPNSTNIFSINGNNVYWNNYNNTWYILGQGTNTLAYSYNGIVWNGLGNTYFTTAGYNIYYNNIQNRFVAVGEGTNSIIYSNDPSGIIWSPVINSTNIFTRGRRVKWIPNLNLWIALGTGNYTIATSLDGINWNGISNSLLLFTVEGIDIDYDGNKIVAVGEGGNSFIYSYDGFNWIKLGNSIFIKGTSIVWTGKFWYATGTGTNTIAKSNDGIVWQYINNSSNLLSTSNYIIGYLIATKISNNPDNINYEIDMNNIVYDNNMLNNYYNYFRKNKLTDYTIYPNSLLNKINEIYNFNYLDIYNINKNNIYQYFQDDFLISNRIIFSNIFENYVKFNLQTYIDISNLDINETFKQYFIQNIMNKNIIDTNYSIDSNNLFFGEYIFTILSDISGTLDDKITYEKQSIIFHNNLIELNEYLTDSSNSRNLIKTLYDNQINLYGIETYLEDIKNKIYLSIRDNDLTYEKYIGLTQQNIYHNFFINDEKQFIFHKYDLSTNNLILNKNTSLEFTIFDSLNNNNYLLEISTNDVYNCFIDNSINIYNNAEYKNKYISLGNTNYKSVITYFYQDELDISNHFIESFNIKSITLNDVSYSLYPYSYSTTLQKNHTHTYYIDLNDYFDRNIYNTDKITIPYNVISFNYIRYKIIDISYVNEFNFYDIDSSINIMYDKSKIELLNSIQIYIKLINFKLDLFSQIIKYNILYLNNINNYNENNYNFINNFSIQNLIDLYEIFDSITSTYIINISNTDINTLYGNNYNNINILIEKYNKIANNFIYHQDLVFDTTINPYFNVTTFTTVDRMTYDLSYIDFGIDKIFHSVDEYFNEIDIIQILNDIEPLPYINYDDINIFINLTIQFYNMKNTIEQILYEFDVRDLNDGLINGQILIGHSYNELYNISDINIFYETLIDNYIILDNLLKFLITYSKIYILTTNGTNIPLTGFNIISSNNVDFIDFSNQSIYVIDNFNAFYNYSLSNYDFLSKVKIYNDIEYQLTGSKFLINSYQSNNILIKFDVIYNSYFYPNIKLDTIVLDILIPDKVPPTIIFNDNVTITIQQNLSTLTNNTIYSIVEQLIFDINYIELDQQLDIIDTSNVNAVFNDYDKLFNNNFVSTNLINEPYSLITLDIRNIYNPLNNPPDDIVEVEIYYIIKDNANNVNIVPRTITVIQSLNTPIFYFNLQRLDIYLNTISPNNWSITFPFAYNITNPPLLANVTAVDPLTGFNIPISISTIEINTRIPGTYNNAITYSATGSNGNISTVHRDIIILPEEIDEVEKIVNTQCCYPPVFYLPLQHRYKLGSGATNVMRLAKIIINR